MDKHTKTRPKGNHIKMNSLFNEFFSILERTPLPAEAFDMGTREHRLAMLWLNKLSMMQCNTELEGDTRIAYMSQLSRCIRKQRLDGIFQQVPPAKLKLMELRDRPKTEQTKPRLQASDTMRKSAKQSLGGQQHSMGNAKDLGIQTGKGFQHLHELPPHKMERSMGDQHTLEDAMEGIHFIDSAMSSHSTAGSCAAHFPRDIMDGRREGITFFDPKLSPPSQSGQSICSRVPAEAVPHQCSEDASKFHNETQKVMKQSLLGCQLILGSTKVGHCRGTYNPKASPMEQSGQSMGCPQEKAKGNKTKLTLQNSACPVKGDKETHGWDSMGCAIGKSMPKTMDTREKCHKKTKGSKKHKNAASAAAQQGDICSKIDAHKFEWPGPSDAGHYLVDSMGRAIGKSQRQSGSQKKSVDNKEDSVSKDIGCCSETPTAHIDQFESENQSTCSGGSNYYTPRSSFEEIADIPPPRLRAKGQKGHPNN
ncbi:uncharacterized protein LOC117896872 [Drosophila subobscura]|uniref:uncharacterized protein LOC117896872 n=1 Tax=Drosophila subobscura TaxID=7241 RepID=UPI00155AC0AB|nr:uncharacterized protein LOC117896872 [Drosophila subobscura]